MIVKTNLYGKIAIGVVAIVFIWFLYNVYKENYEKNREEAEKGLREPPSTDFDAATIEDADNKYKDLKEKAELYLKTVEKYNEEKFNENAVKWRAYLNDLNQNCVKIIISHLKTPPDLNISAKTYEELKNLHRKNKKDAETEIKELSELIKQYGNRPEFSKNKEQWESYIEDLKNHVYDCPQHDLNCVNCNHKENYIICPRCKGKYSGFIDNCDSCDDPKEQGAIGPGSNPCPNHILKEKCPYCGTKEGKFRIIN